VSLPDGEIHADADPRHDPTQRGDTEGDRGFGSKSSTRDAGALLAGNIASQTVHKKSNKKYQRDESSGTFARSFWTRQSSQG
jgi:hypothetical protein